MKRSLSILFLSAGLCIPALAQGDWQSFRFKPEPPAPYRKIVRPRPVISVVIDRPHEFEAYADCPVDWTVDVTDALDFWPSSRSGRKAILLMMHDLICRKATWDDKHSDGFYKEHQLDVHYVGKGLE